MSSRKKKELRRANGEGGISYLGDNRRKPWLARITVGYRPSGSQIFEPLGTYEKREDALLALKEYNERKYNLIDRKITFEQLYYKWTKKHFKKITEGSQKGYKTAFNHCTSIYDRRFAELRNSDLQKVIDECRQRICNETTYKKFIQYVI